MAYKGKGEREKRQRMIEIVRICPWRVETKEDAKGKSKMKMGNKLK